MTVQPDLGISSAKYTSTDELLSLMRRVIAEVTGISRADAIQAFKAALRDDESLQDDAFDYVAIAEWNRCTRPRDNHEDMRERTERVTAEMKDIALAKIVLWTWKLPTTGKPLSESTFAEIAEAAPLTGRFLAKLAMQGAPGSLVKEVFLDKAALQDFWVQSQK